MFCTVYNRHKVVVSQTKEKPLTIKIENDGEYIRNNSIISHFENTLWGNVGL